MSLVEEPSEIIIRGSQRKARALVRVSASMAAALAAILGLSVAAIIFPTASEWVLALLLTLVSGAAFAAVVWQGRRRRGTDIVLRPEGVTIIQGEQSRTWNWRDVEDPRVLPRAEGVIFYRKISFAGEDRILGDSYEVSPSEIVKLLHEGKARWS